MSEKKFKDGACCDSCGSTTYREIFKPFSMDDAVIAEQPIVIGYDCADCGKKIPNPEKYAKEKNLNQGVKNEREAAKK